ncbi:hypothetical protein [Paenibacillus selenitireducens]|uniref:hypothetical protein n=1 Tax=Paenibacillus selenitireducens TaxID=1324314 RepID=UPI001301DBD3|nr:hypothetical protein [Paenibacillus selenitireducens]
MINVEFDIGQDQLAMVTRELKRVVEPGRFAILVGGDSQRVLRTELEVISDQ